MNDIKRSVVMSFRDELLGTLLCYTIAQPWSLRQLIISNHATLLVGRQWHKRYLLNWTRICLENENENVIFRIPTNLGNPTNDIWKLPDNLFSNETKQTHKQFAEKCSAYICIGWVVCKLHYKVLLQRGAKIFVLGHKTWNTCMCEYKREIQ
jgi:hypothetical protein